MDDDEARQIRIAVNMIAINEYDEADKILRQLLKISKLKEDWRKELKGNVVTGVSQTVDLFESRHGMRKKVASFPTTTTEPLSGVVKRGDSPSSMSGFSESSLSESADSESSDSISSLSSPSEYSDG